MRNDSAAATQPAFSSSVPAGLEEILITDKLRIRPRRMPNLQAEGTALRVLARKLATEPHQLMDTLLEMVVELCHAGTAGLSVLEVAKDADQLFRWTNLAGTLKKFVGVSTPRNFSPCGLCLDRNAPQLFAYPARRFQYLREVVDVPIVEALVIPIQLGDRVPATVWILSHEEGVEFDEEDVRIMTDLADFTGCALGLTESLEAEQKARRRSEAVVETRTSQLRQLSAKLLILQDQERRRIARELHDSAGQYLSSIQMNLSAALRENSTIDARLASRISDSLEIAERCTSEIRTISYLLHPPLLDEMGLASALSWYVDGLAERSGIRMELDIPEDLGRLPSDTETALFRVVQQGLANIHRHSGSLVARICVRIEAENVTVKICDEGRGIQPEVLSGFLAGTQLVGVGMAGMRERITSIGGQFEIRSGDNGTTIEATLPLPREKCASELK
jgi:signal transduction histidine kinase